MRCGERGRRPLISVFANWKQNWPKQKDNPPPQDAELIESFDCRPARQSHSCGLIRLFLDLALSAIGYRGTARALKIVAPLLPHGEFPSANGGQTWLLRLGLYELQRSKEPADDWVWIIDHTVQTGNGKCFVVVGVRLSAWNAKREEAVHNAPEDSFSLTHQDLSVWSIDLMESSTAEDVREQLEALSASTHITPCALLSDQGADVRSGGELFCQARERSTVMVFDIAHAVANAVKRQLNHDPLWQEFLGDVTRCKSLIRQTPLAFLLPPELKTKARWMNLEPLLAWSRRVAAFLKDPPAGLAQAEVEIDLEILERKVGWLRKYEIPMARWSDMLEVGTIYLKYIRNHGYHRQTCEELRPLLSGFTEGPARAMSEECLAFIQRQSEQSGEQRLLGSSEVLESLIGKGKQLQGRNKNGYTKSILAMAAAVTQRTTQTINSALSTIKVRDVADWIQNHLGLSLQSQRHRALDVPFQGTEHG